MLELGTKIEMNGQTDVPAGLTPGKEPRHPSDRRLCVGFKAGQHAVEQRI